MAERTGAQQQQQPQGEEEPGLAVLSHFLTDLALGCGSWTLFQPSLSSVFPKLVTEKRSGMLFVSFGDIAEES